MPSSRRDFLKLASAFAGGTALASLSPLLASSAQADKPNILILVFDTMSAPHLSLYGYPRATTPNLERFAERATVFHNHYAEGSFTTPGTASLLMGLNPWTHRAINAGGLVRRDLVENNIFRVAGTDYQRIAFTQNYWVEVFFRQFRADIDLHLPATSFAYPNPLLLGEMDREDPVPYFAYEDFLVGGVKLDTPYPGSVLLGMLDAALGRGEALNPELAPGEQKGVCFNGYYYYLNHTVFDGIRESVKQASNQGKPYLGYYHLWSPHEPYSPAKDFNGLFDDKLKLPRKPYHPLAGDNFKDQELYQFRRVYDQYVANVDAEFGLLMDSLERDGLLDNTVVIVTSDHGQLFERGVHGHSSRLLYDGVTHVPLIVSVPGQARRADVREATGNADLLPTIAALTGGASTRRTEGRVLPGLGGESAPERSYVSMMLHENSAFLPLTNGTYVLTKGARKLMLFTGYEGFEDSVELYDLEADPNELRDLAKDDPATAKQMKEELLDMRGAADGKLQSE
ncbi:MAG: sulfatase-like hydrolase/transferase [Chloroflexota bacterium]